MLNKLRESKEYSNISIMLQGELEKTTFYIEKLKFFQAFLYGIVPHVLY